MQTLHCGPCNCLTGPSNLMPGCPILTSNGQLHRAGQHPHQATLSISFPATLSPLTMSGVGLPAARSSACLTILSSSEWKDITARRPPGPRQSSASGRAAASRRSSSLIAMRNTWKVRVAGWMPRASHRRPLLLLLLLLLPRICVSPMAHTSCCVVQIVASSRPAMILQHSTAGRARCTSCSRAQHQKYWRLREHAGRVCCADTTGTLLLATLDATYHTKGAQHSSFPCPRRVLPSSAHLTTLRAAVPPPCHCPPSAAKLHPRLATPNCRCKLAHTSRFGMSAYGGDPCQRLRL